MSWLDAADRNFRQIQAQHMKYKATIPKKTTEKAFLLAWQAHKDELRQICSELSKKIFGKTFFGTMKVRPKPLKQSRLNAYFKDFSMERQEGYAIPRAGMVIGIKQNMLNGSIRLFIYAWEPEWGQHGDCWYVRNQLYKVKESARSIAELKDRIVNHYAYIANVERLDAPEGNLC
jgi:hypothetical protein